MSNYLHMETLAPEQAEAAAYYLGAVPPMPDTLVEDLERQVYDGGIAYNEALDVLMRAGQAVGGSDFDVDPAKAHIETQLQKRRRAETSLTSSPNRGEQLPNSGATCRRRWPSDSAFQMSTGR